MQFSDSDSESVAKYHSHSVSDSDSDSLSCKFACAFRVCSAGVARVYFGFGCDHSAPATMIKRRLSKSERECD